MDWFTDYSRRREQRMKVTRALTDTMLALLDVGNLEEAARIAPVLLALAVADGVLAVDVVGE